MEYAADFSNEQVRPSSMMNQGPRLARIIDDDQSVSANYGRMAWNGMEDLYHGASEEQTIGEYRKEFLGDLQDAMQTLFSDPELSLQDFGGVKAGAFRFSKGNVSNFHYKNLSAGEKAAFDILLDVFVKRREVPEAVFCIDEPELHVATGLQGALIAATLKLLPESAQLWVATHSIGIVREAYRMQRDQPSKVAFLDFSGQDFDKPVTIAPSRPTRAFWRNIYKVTLDDLAFLVAPQRVVICEGSKEKLIKAFDADCYNRLFSDESLETLFIPQGGSRQVIQSLDLMAILNEIVAGIKIHRLIDRDDMTDDERDRKISEGIRVLRRRELEEYLYDSEVLRTFLKSKGFDAVVSDVLQQRDALRNKQSGPPNIKDLSQRLLGIIRSLTALPNLGNSRTEFALQYLVPALRETETVYEELREDVFGSR